MGNKTARLKIRVTEEDLRHIDVVTEMFGISRSAAVRFLIRQWTAQRKSKPESSGRRGCAISGVS